jgi:hypothetical protein
MAKRLYSKGHPAQGVQVTSPELRQNFLALDDRIMGANAKAQGTPGMTVAVDAFEYLGSDNISWKAYAGGNSPAITAPTTNPRIALLTVDDTGALAWTYGAEAASPLKPNPPAGKVPICWVYGRVAMTLINDEDSGSHGFILAQASALRPIPSAASLVPKGQCRLTKSGSNLLLSPFQGNLLTTNSVDRIIPDAGVTLGTGGLSASTTYFIYAFDNAGTLTLEASTTAPVVQAGTGIRIKGGPDATRTLVGMARTTAGTAWIDDAENRLVISYFHRRTIHLKKDGPGGTTTATSLTEINSGFRLTYLTWADEAVHIGYSGAASNNTANQFVGVGLAPDGTPINPLVFQQDATANNNASITISTLVSQTEAVHDLRLFGIVQSGTGTYRADGTLWAAIRG